jgi:hypothetical protein
MGEIASPSQCSLRSHFQRKDGQIPGFLGDFQKNPEKRPQYVASERWKGKI